METSTCPGPSRTSPLGVWARATGWVPFLLGLLVVAEPGSAQDVEPDPLTPEVTEAFFHALGNHFQVSLREIRIIADWDLSPDEVPVVLFLSRRAGVSPDALAGFRREGREWLAVASVFGVGPRTLHLDLPREGDLGVLEEVYRQFRSLPTRGWDRIRLGDEEIVTLVNLRVLSRELELSPLDILRTKEEAGSFALSYTLLRNPS